MRITGGPELRRVCTGSGQRSATSLQQCTHSLVVRETNANRLSARRDFRRDVSSCFANQSQRPRPKGVGEMIENRRGFSDEPGRLITITDDNEDWLVLFPALEFFDSLHRCAIERICAETIERIGAKGDDAAAVDCLRNHFARSWFIANDHVLERRQVLSIYRPEATTNLIAPLGAI